MITHTESRSTTFSFSAQSPKSLRHFYDLDRLYIEYKEYGQPDVREKRG